MRKCPVGWVALLTLFGLLGPASALTVRVDPAHGAPRWVVNGRPVRARVFWGAPGSTPLPLTPTPREISFEFVAAGTATTGTMHFRFGQTAGEVALDDITVTDLSDNHDVLPRCDFEGGPASFAREWNVWPPDARNTVGVVSVAPGAGRNGSAGLRVRIHAPADGQWPDFHIYHNGDLSLVAGHRYRVRFWAQAEPARDLTVAFYRPGTTYVHLGGPASVFEAQIKLAAGAGVNFVSFPVGLPWPEPGRAADWADADESCARVLRANPNALLLPRIDVYPPDWWCRAFPDDVMRWEDGAHGNYAVPASPRFRRDAAERLAALVRHLEATFGDHIAGYHPTGQNTGEWFYQDTWKRPLNGYAPADLVAWRLWLHVRYVSDAALQHAWRLPAVTCDTATVPTPAERHAASNGVFRDPQTERPLIDWATFQQETMADCVTTLAHAVRTASRGQKLVLFFYGYLFEFGAVPTGPSVSGHYALRRVLDCPDIDVLCSPISYFDRGLGGSAPSMTAAESVALAGKMWLNEDDTHTYRATGDQPGSQDHVTTLADTNAELTRNVAQESLRNLGTWWMDLGASGWFDDPGMWAQMARLNALEAPLLRTPTPFHPQVAAVMDERAMRRVAEGGTTETGPGVYEARRPLGRLGAPYGQYLLDDVLTRRVNARLYVFLNAWALSAAERAQLRRATRGSVQVWCYAPGLFDDNHASPDAMQQLTGFAFKPVTPQKAWATPTAVGQRLGLQPFGVNGPVKPLFAATDATDAETLARYPDGSAAIALRQTSDGVSLFVGVPGLTPELLRLAARKAGVHLFTQTDCNVYANGPFLALHGAQGGPITVNTGKKSVIYDVLTGAKVGVGPQLTLPLQHGETRVLRY